MKIHISRHARDRMAGRGATESEIVTTLAEGTFTDARRGRMLARQAFDFNAASPVNGCVYRYKILEVLHVIEDNEIVVVTVKVYYGNEVRT